MVNRIPSWQRQAWLTEYQVCQSDSNAMIRTHWTVAGIFMAVNTALLAWIARAVISGNLPVGSPRYLLSTFTASIVVVVFSLGIICILVLLILWLNRVNFLLDRNRCRMKRIEENLEMVGDVVPDTEDERKNRRSQHKCKYFPCIPSDGALPVKLIYLIFILLWIATIVGALVIDC